MSINFHILYIKKKKKSQIRRSGRKSNTEQAQLLMKYNTKFHREREREKHYLVSEIWSFRTFAIVPTNNTNTTTKQRPTHFIDTAIVNVTTAFSLSLSLCLQKKKKKTRIQRIKKKSKKKRRKERRAGERVRD